MNNREKQFLSKRLRTPLQRGEVEKALATSAIQSDVFFRIKKQSIRNEKGERLCDILYDTETADKKFDFKTKTHEHFIIDLKELERRFQDLEQAM